LGNLDEGDALSHTPALDASFTRALAGAALAF